MSRQADDNRGFYCTLIELVRNGVLYLGFLPKELKFHSFLALYISVF